MVWHYATSATKNLYESMVQGACIYLSLHKNFALSFLFLLSKLLVPCKCRRSYMFWSHTVCSGLSELGVGITLEEFFFCASSTFCHVPVS